jgi:hypothetical protein
MATSAGSIVLMFEVIQHHSEDAHSFTARLTGGGTLERD